jgi:hypothetical protein
MSTKVTGWVWDQDLLIQRKAVLLWLAERATDNGVCFPGQAEVRRKTGLGEKMVRRHLHWLASDHDDAGRPKQPLLTIVERRVDADRNTSNVYVLHVPWARPDQVARELNELKHVPRSALHALQQEGVADDPHAPTATTGGGHPRPQWRSSKNPMGVTGDGEEPSPPDRHRNHTPLPPTSQQQLQQQGVGVATPESGSAGERDVTTETDVAIEADRLIEAFYKGLGVGTGGLTRSILARERSIARQLIEAGTTSAEAEAYAHEMASVPNRLAPIDLRSFERERSTWTARQGRAATSSRRYVDRTGQGIDDSDHEPDVAPPESVTLGPEVRGASALPFPPAPAPSSLDGPVGNVRSPADWSAALRRRLEGEQS